MHSHPSRRLPGNHAKPRSGFALSFVVPNEGALSLAFTAGSLPIINELLLHRWRRRELSSKARDVRSNPLRSPPTIRCVAPCPLSREGRRLLPPAVCPSDSPRGALLT